MITNLLNEGLVKELTSLQMEGRVANPDKYNWSYCSDGSCSGDCVGGCDGTPAGGF